MKKLKALGCEFYAPITQEDSVYTKNVVETLFTFKKKGMNDLDAIEHEVTINSKEEMEQALMSYSNSLRLSVLIKKTGLCVVMIF